LTGKQSKTTYPLPLGFQHTQYRSLVFLGHSDGVAVGFSAFSTWVLCAFGSDDVESSEQAMRDGLDDSLIDTYRGIIERASCIVGYSFGTVIVSALTWLMETDRTKKRPSNTPKTIYFLIVDMATLV
jgi:hypothetical protein